MTPPILEVDGLSRRFGGLKAVDGLSLRLQSQSILGLLGPNGSGKTTALNLISGVLAPDAGSVRLGGKNVSGLPAFRLARKGIARTFQLVRVFKSMTVRENVVAGMAFTSPRLFARTAIRKTDEILHRVGLRERADKSASDLNYIDQKRLELARALAANPKVLLLDEWLAGLNPTELLQAIDLVRQVRADGVSIILVEHVLEAVKQLCDQCLVMNAGMQIATGSPAEVFSDPHVIDAYLGRANA